MSIPVSPLVSRVMILTRPFSNSKEMKPTAIAASIAAADTASAASSSDHHHGSKLHHEQFLHGMSFSIHVISNFQNWIQSNIVPNSRNLINGPPATGHKKSSSGSSTSSNPLETSVDGDVAQQQNRLMADSTSLKRNFQTPSPSLVLKSQMMRNRYMPTCLSV